MRFGSLLWSPAPAIVLKYSRWW